MLRAIREIQPRWVVGENVRGLTNWNGGLVFDEVQADLENEGYEVTPYLLPACAVNAPHRRDRIWFVAYSNKGGHSPNAGQGGKQNQVPSFDRPEVGTRLSYGATTQNPDEIRCDSYQPKGQPGKREQREFSSGNNVRLSDATNADCFRQNPSECEYEKQPSEGREYAQHDFEQNGNATNANEERLERTAENGYMGGEQRLVQRCTRRQWENFPTQPPVCSRNDGLSDRLDGITFPKWREKSIGAYGNAIVPQVAYQIFKAIEQYENLKK
jgi:DNA (cytosine-5)-methyltransferase 1